GSGLTAGLAPATGSGLVLGKIRLIRCLDACVEIFPQASLNPWHPWFFISEGGFIHLPFPAQRHAGVAAGFDWPRGWVGTKNLWQT
ncbi:MAG: hypothetical protein ACP5I4_15555, partial [Oceanipulchritudo sp.]